MTETWLWTALNVLLALMGNTQLVKECLAYNGILCLLYVFCCQQDEEVRKAACEVLCKMTSDKLMGPKVRRNFKGTHFASSVQSENST